MTTTAFATVEPTISRDRWGRPLVVPPGGGDPVPYQRPSSYGKTLEDTFNLHRWDLRNVARGLAGRPELTTAVLSANGNDKVVDDAIEKARQAVSATSKATYGTAVHALTEAMDRGEDIPDGLDEPTKRSLKAYRAAMDGLEVVASERFVVCDHGPGFAGTLDRLLRLPDGTVVVGDVKTGNTDKRTGKLAYVHGVAVQLAIYARSVFYDIATGQRQDTPDIYPNAGLVIHLPAGEGTAQLHWIDLAAGWEAVQLAIAVKDWRKRRGLTQTYADEHAG